MERGTLYIYCETCIRLYVLCNSFYYFLSVTRSGLFIFSHSFLLYVFEQIFLFVFEISAFSKKFHENFILPKTFFSSFSLLFFFLDGLSGNSDNCEDCISLYETGRHICAGIERI